MLQHLRILSILIVLFFAALLPLPIYAQSVPETPTTTLIIENSSDSNITVCDIFALREPNEIVIDQEKEITLAASKSIIFAIPAGEYRLLVTDCEQNILHQVSRVPYSLQAQIGPQPFTSANQATKLNTFMMPTSILSASSAKCRELLLQGEEAHYRNDYEVALLTFNKTLKCFRDAGDQVGEGETIYDIGAVYTRQERYLEAQQQYASALTIFRDFYDREKEGITLHQVAFVYDLQGQYNEALKNYEAALEIQRELGNSSGDAVTLHNIGLVYSHQEHYAEAMIQFRAALAIEREVNDLNAEGATHNAMADVYYAQGHYANALVENKLGLLIWRNIGNRAQEGITLNNIGAIYAAQGNYAEANQNYQAALIIAREVGDRRGEGRTLNLIGTTYYAQGRYSEALAQFEAVLVLIREKSDSEGEAMALINIGVVYSEQDRFNEALEKFTASQAILHGAGTQSQEGRVFNNIGEVYNSLGRYPEALAQYELALSIYRKIGDRSGEGTTLNNIGTIYTQQGRYAQALIQEKSALVIMREVGNRFNEATILANIAFIYLKQKRYAEAVRYYSESLDIFENIRSVAGNDLARTSFTNIYSRAYDQIVNLFYENNNLEQAFWYSERGRARVLLDGLTTGQVQLFNDNESAELLAQEQEAYVVRQSAQDTLAKARTTTPPDPAWVSDAEKALQEAEVAYQKVVNVIAARHDQLADLIPGRQRVSQLADVQKLLDNQTTLLSYWELNDKTLAFIITANGSPTVIELPAATPKKIQAKLKSLYTRYQATPPQVSSDEYPLELQDLYLWLVKPLTPYLKTEHVAIVPHQFLHSIPFAALVDETQLELAPAQRQAYFGQQHILTILPSASSLTYLAKNATLAAANSSSTTKSRTTTKSLVLGNPNTKVPGLLPLTHAASEAQAVAALLNTQVYTGALATESRVKASPGLRILHLAAHGIYNQNNALYSALYLTSGGTDDGKLETHEIFGLPLKGNDIVVLSACETNLGDLSGGDDIVGLTRAFFFAGSPTVISSLWNVNDEATATLMVAFYRHWLQKGMSKAEALQAAQADVRNAGWESPFYWAGFVLNGDHGVARYY